MWHISVRITNLPHYEIVATIGAELRGIANYYMMARDVGSQIQEVYWYGKECARKTIAFKYRLRKRKSYIKYTYQADRPNERSYLQIAVPREGKTPLVAKCGETPLKTNTFTQLSDVIPKYRIVGTNSELVRRLLAEKCELCETHGYVEAHHTNKIANLKKKYAGRKAPPPWAVWMIRRNCKTIMVCKPCHNNITYGRYDGRKVS